MSLGEGNILLDGDNNKIKVGVYSTKSIEIKGSSTQGYIVLTGKDSININNKFGFWLVKQ